MSHRNDQEIITATDTGVLLTADALYSTLPMWLPNMDPAHKPNVEFAKAVRTELEKRFSDYCPVPPESGESSSSHFTLDTELAFASLAGLTLIETVYAFYHGYPDRFTPVSMEGFDHLLRYLRWKQYKSDVYFDHTTVNIAGSVRLLFHCGNHRFDGNALVRAAVTAHNLSLLGIKVNPAEQS